MSKKLSALILALLLLLGGLIPATAEEGDVHLSLVALETSGVMVQLENYGLEMKMDFYFHPDGTARCVYSYADNGYDLTGTYTTLGAGYQFLCQGFDVTLLRNEEGYYVWAQDGVNELFLEVSDEENGGGLVYEHPALPTQLTSRRAPFPGTLEEHVQALLWVGETLNDVTIEYAESGSYDSTFGWERFVCKGNDLYIVYLKDGSGVVSYVYGIDVSTLLSAAELNQTITGQNISVIPAMAVLRVETGFDDAALVEALNSFDQKGEVDVLAGAIQAADSAANVFSYSHYFTVFFQEVGEYTDCYWFLFHNTSDSGAPAPTPSYAKRVDPVPNQTPEPVAPVPVGPAVGGSWKCPGCGATNSGAKCLVCGTARPEEPAPTPEPAPQPEPEPEPQPQPQPAPVPDSHWKCPGCGATNSGKSCLVCGTARPDAAPEPEPTPAPAPANANWKCPGCGATNSGAKCLVCGTSRP